MNPENMLCYMTGMGVGMCLYDLVSLYTGAVCLPFGQSCLEMQDELTVNWQ